MSDDSTVSKQDHAKQDVGEPKKSGNLTTWILISLVAGLIVGIVCSLCLPGDSPVYEYVINGVFYVAGQWFIRLM